MNKILILTDSLGLPRDVPERVHFEDTWPHHLKDEKTIIIQLSLGGATSSDLCAQVHYYKNLNPDVVIVQVGIVDCAPRALGYYENLIFKRWRLTGFLCQIALSHFGKSIRNIRNISYTSPLQFRKNVICLLNCFPNSKMLFVGILPANNSYEQQVHGIQNRIKQYNSILKDTCQDSYIDMCDIPCDCIMSDYHHLNVNGHKFLFDKVRSKLNK